MARGNGRDPERRPEILPDMPASLVGKLDDVGFAWAVEGGQRYLLLEAARWGPGMAGVFGSGELREGWIWIEYTPVVDMLFVRLIDMLVYVRQSAPQVVQLRLVK